jgi:hypothetical protein
MQRWQLRARRWETSALHRRNGRYHHHAERAAQRSATEREPEQLLLPATANDAVPLAV